MINQENWDRILAQALDVTHFTPAIMGYATRQYDTLTNKTVDVPSVRSANCVNCSAPVKRHRDNCDHCGTIYQ